MKGAEQSAPRDLLDKGKADVDKFFLGDRAISSGKVAHLLTSSSFGVNAILYAAWLGYAMGAWAILVQAAWSVSFLLFARYANKVYHFTSLHDFLGSTFGRTTQRVGAILSIIGLLYFAGWEIAIAQSGLAALPVSAGMLWPILIAIFIVIAILYTSFGGQKANSEVDKWLNIVKYFLLAFVVIAAIIGAINSVGLSAGLIFPPISSAFAVLGVLGFFTNLVFNLSWQFVDNTSWQSVSSNKKDPRRSLILAGGGTFVAYLLSTFLGAVLRVSTSLTSDNILAAATFGLSGALQVVIIVAVVLLILLSMMSLIDGISLSVSQSAAIDLNFLKRFAKKPKQRMLIARILTVAAGVIAAWGVNLLISAMGGGIFDFVYILIVAQLSMIGPILVGLMAKKPPKIRIMWLALVVAVVVGIFSSAFGVASGIQWLVDGAGTLTVAVSIILAVGLYFLSKRQNINR